MNIAAWKDTVEVLGSLATTLALGIGGVGAYFKFFKGRVFHTRLSLTLNHSWVQKDGSSYLSLVANVQNTGTSNVTLVQSEQGEHFLKIWACEVVPNTTLWETCLWEIGQAIPIFKYEDNIEAGESVSEEHLVIVPSSGQIAFKIEFGVRARKNPLKALLRREQDYHRWKCEKIITASETV
jgi:hypothetical protein